MISFVIANTSKRAVSEVLYHGSDAAPFIVSLQHGEVVSQKGGGWGR